MVRDSARAGTVADLRPELIEEIGDEPQFVAHSFRKEFDGKKTAAIAAARSASFCAGML